MSKPEFHELTAPESTRRYYFPDGSRVTLEGVQRVAVSESGTHRLETADGKKHIVPTGWIHIEFEAAEWSF